MTKTKTIIDGNSLVPREQSVQSDRANRSAADQSLPVASSAAARTPRVRVRLQRINCNYSKPYPPHGQGKLWWGRLREALGTTSNAFVQAALVQIQEAARLGGAGISETGFNAVLAQIEAAEPRDEVQAALAIQMACTHAAAMFHLSRCITFTRSQQADLQVKMTTRLLKMYAQQAETLHRLKRGGSQNIRVEHVHVHDGAHAIVGNVKANG